MSPKSATPDGEAARIAAWQHGVVTRRQLLEAGLGPTAIKNRTRKGQLHRVHQGVYAVGHTAPSRGRGWMAAVLACGTRAVLSHMSAAALWGLLRPEGGSIDVSVPSSNGRSRRNGIRVHRSPSLAAPPSRDDAGREIALTTVHDGIPVTSIARTIRDLERTAPPYLVRRAIRQAQLAGARIDQRAKVKTRRTRSDFELDFLALCERHALPLPEVNVKVGRWEVDFLWRSQRLAVETDSYATHRGSIAFENDHQREMDLRRHALTVHRYTEAQIRNHPALVVADLGEVLRGVR